MSPYPGARLEFSCDLDQDGTVEDLVFDMRGQLQIDIGLINSPLIDQWFNQANAAIEEWFGDTDAAGGKNQGFTLDFGGGEHYCEVSFRGWEGSGSQWGATGDDSEVTADDATGADPRTQLVMLDRAFQLATIDSDNPATLHVFDYSDQGLYDPLQVGPVDPNGVFDATETSSWFDGSIRFVEISALTSVFDGRNQRA